MGSEMCIRDSFAIDRLSLAMRSLGQVEGTRSPVLRETRMPAVVFRLGPRDGLEALKTPISSAIHEALAHWIRVPHEMDSGNIHA